MGTLAKDAIKFAADRSGRIAAQGRGNWRKMVAFGAAAAIVFAGSAIAYAAWNRKRKEEPENREAPVEESQKA